MEDNSIINYSTLINENLYSLYEFISKKHKDYNIINTKKYSFVKSISNSWPNFIYNIDLVVNFRNNIKKIANEINNDVAPPFLIVNSNQENNVNIALIERQGFKKVVQWLGMALNLDNFENKFQAPKNFEIKEVLIQEDLDNWFNIVNENLFRFNKFKNNIFEKLITKKEIKLFIAYIDGIPAATSMLFTSNKVAGIYMVTVDEKYRNVGAGTLITAKALDEAKKLKCNTSCLQSTDIAIKMYKDLGYKEFCIIDIYWKVGKF